MIGKKLFSWGVGLATAIPLMTLAAAVPASAHESCSGMLDKGYGCVSAGHNRITACDTVSDHWGVRVYYVTSNNRRDHVGDANGHSAPCGSEAPTGGGVVTLYKFCTGPQGQDHRCGPWVTP